MPPSSQAPALVAQAARMVSSSARELAGMTRVALVVDCPDELAPRIISTLEWYWKLHLGQAYRECSLVGVGKIPPREEGT